MNTSEIIELLKALGPIAISLFCFGVNYKIMNEKISVYKEREKNYKKQFELFEKVKDSETNHWKTKAEELAKQLTDNIKSEINFKKIEISKPNLITNSIEGKNVFTKYIDFFNTIKESDFKNFDFNLETLIMLHMYFYGIKDYEKASLALSEAIKKDPFNSSLYSYQAGTFKKMGKIEEAIEYCKKAISLNSNNADALYNLTTLMAIKGDFVQAKSLAQKTIEVNPDFRKIIINSTYLKEIKLED
ncbi:MAG: tetratricopeptide repeat protein [Limnohabitans sp.]|nr:tetratricopeptide repeat protein [Limnohabitans sp.]